MNDRKRSTFYSVVLAAALAGGPAACQPALPPPQQDTVDVLVLEMDTSGTSTVPPEKRCESVGRRIAAAVEASQATWLELRVLQLGTSATANEPVALTGWVRVQKAPAPFAAPEAGEESIRAALRAVIAECQQGARATDESPVHRGVTRGVELVSARCAELERGGARCASEVVHAQSDLRETSHRRLVNRIKALARGEAPRPLPDGDLLRAGRVRLEICGTSEVNDRGERESVLASPAAVAVAWAPVLGPNAFVSPFCP